MLAQWILSDPVSLLNLTVNGGALVLLAYIVIKVAPAMMKESREERETTHKQFADALLLLQDRFQGRTDKVVDAMEKQTKDIVDSVVRLEAMILNQINKKWKTPPETKGL